MELSLRDRVAVVTGGASGIGRSMAEMMANAGARVFSVDRNQNFDLPARITQVQADVTAADSSARVVAEIVQAAGRIDVLCNNAGIMDRFVPAAETDDDLWNSVIAVNLTAPFTLTREVLPLMRAQGGGVITNTASVSGLRGGGAGAAYTVSKAGVIALTRHVAALYDQYGVRCNAICPGVVETNIRGGVEIHEAGQATALEMRPSTLQRGAPSDIGGLALFLASDQARFINGAVIVADGGWMSH